MHNLEIQQQVILVLNEVLTPTVVDSNTQLLGHLPEFDSMSIMNVLVSLEEKFGFVIDDNEIELEMFADVSALTAFCAQKMACKAD